MYTCGECNILTFWDISGDIYIYTYIHIYIYIYIYYYHIISYVSYASKYNGYPLPILDKPQELVLLLLQERLKGIDATTSAVDAGSIWLLSYEMTWILNGIDSYSMIFRIYPESIPQSWQRGYWYHLLVPIDVPRHYVNWWYTLAKLHRSTEPNWNEDEGRSRLEEPPRTMAGSRLWLTKSWTVSA